MNIKDIAKEANVSFKTVSRVLNNAPGVRPSTRDKVLEVLKKYNYTLNPKASGLSRKSSNTVLIVTNILHNECPLQKNSLILEHILKHLTQQGYIGVVANSTDNLKKTVYGTYDKGYFDGAIILAPKDFTFIEELEAENKPFIISGISEVYDYIGTDQAHGCYMATKHLLELGCKSISLLLDDTKAYTASEKLAGYKRALNEFNLEFDAQNVRKDIYSSEQVEDLITQLHQSHELPDAFIINSDYPSLGAVRAINKLGIKCPQDLKIVSFGDTYICKETAPSLTAVKQNFTLIGEHLVNYIVNKINGEGEAKTVSIPAELTIRTSTQEQIKRS